MARKRLTLAAALLAAGVAGEARVDAGDLLGTLGLGHCSTCQRSYATVPAYVPMPVAQAYYYAPPTAMMRSVQGQAPDPAPHWARPRGTVPVLALQEPAPKWADIDPAALAASSYQYPTPVAQPYPTQVAQPYPTPVAQPYPTVVQPIASGQQLVQTPVAPNYVQPQQGQQVAMQPIPGAAYPQPQPGAAFAQPGGAYPQPGGPYPQPGAAFAQPGANAAAPVPTVSSSDAQLPPGHYVMTPQGPQLVAEPQAGPSVAGPAANAPYPAGPYPAAAPHAAAQGGPNYGAPAGPYLSGPAPVMTAPRTRNVQAFDDDTSRPPPGTLGRTYMRPVRMVPWDKHPRTGMVDVEVLDTLTQGLAHDVKIKVTTEDMYGNYEPLEGFRGENGVWHFESDHPLLPTVPHIYNVRVEVIREVTVSEVRYGRTFYRVIEKSLGKLASRRIRLIPGRIVDLIVY
ncbi:MAG: hypothetical protein O2820_05455 [Planctomycetota bacterium]|nr:hypothetical protein [Planctomycetota bacterium]MDA1248651.1 hypothetical protein [Planctomycetota bacterium]